MFKPDIQLHRITDVTPELLHKMGVTGLVLDVDNTMITHKGKELIPGLIEWFTLMDKNGVKLIILSNGKTKRLSAFAARVNLPFLAAGLKPLPFSYWRAVKKLGLKSRQSAICGDQIFTDILGGKLAGLKTILLTPIEKENKTSFKIRRYFEDKLKNRWNT